MIQADEHPACGVLNAGPTTPAIETECVDTNIDDNGNELTDGADGCSTYVAGWCGNFDTDTFISTVMCCACGGGDGEVIIIREAQ